MIVNNYKWRFYLFAYLKKSEQTRLKSGERWFSQVALLLKENSQPGADQEGEGMDKGCRAFERQQLREPEDQLRILLEMGIWHDLTINNRDLFMSISWAYHIIITLITHYEIDMPIIYPLISYSYHYIPIIVIMILYTHYMPMIYPLGYAHDSPIGYTHDIMG